MSSLDQSGDPGVLGAISEQESTAIDSAVEACLSDGHVPGCSLAVVRNDQVVYARGYGLRDVEDGLPVTTGTLFPIGSCTNAFTAMVLQMSEDDGLLSLDDHPRNYLPYFSLLDPEADSQVTIRDLLCHRTGLAPHTGSNSAFSDTLSREENIRSACSSQPTARFREHAQYNDIMVVAAGEIAARVNGSTWDEVIERRILRPLGMNRTHTDMKTISSESDYAKGYKYDPASGLNLCPIRALRAVAPAGAIYSNAPDMSRWVRFMLNGGIWETNRLVSERGFADLTTDHIQEHGLGWLIRHTGRESLIWNNGGFDGFYCELCLLPKSRIGLIMLTNHGAADVGTAFHAICRALLVNDRAVSDSAASLTTDSEIPDESNVYQPTISVDGLMNRVIDAQGGEQVLRRHTSMTWRADLEIPSHGATCRMIHRQEVPHYVHRLQEFYKGDRLVFSQRTIFDGNSNRVEIVQSGKTTVQEKQDTTGNDLISSTFHHTLDWKTLFPTVKILGSGLVGSEEVYIVEKTPDTGDPIMDYVSTTSFRVLKQCVPSPGGPQTLVQSDFRTVDGQLVPFEIVAYMGDLPLATCQVTQYEFNTPRSAYPEFD